jgi:lipopolysaccharide transport system permease protein
MNVRQGPEAKKTISGQTAAGVPPGGVPDQEYPTIIIDSVPRSFRSLKEIWVNRELLAFFVWKDLKVRFKQTLIGGLWIIIQPLATMLVFSLFFGRLARMPSGGIPYPLFYFSALLPWFYFANAVTQATHTMVENQRVITKVYFPRLLLPIAAVISGLVDLAIAFIPLLGMAIFYGVSPSPRLLLIPLFALMALTAALGIGLWLSALNALYRDVRYALPFLIQLWMFASPVVYPVSIIPAQWRWLYNLNPLAGIIEGFRWAVVGQGTPPDLNLLVSLAVIAILLLSGLSFFLGIEGTIIDMV